MGVRQRINIGPSKPQNEYLELFLAKDNLINKTSNANAGAKNLQIDVDIKGSETETSTDLLFNSIEDKTLLSTDERLKSNDTFIKRRSERKLMTRTRKKAQGPRIQTYGRGRPRKKSFGKKFGNSNDKQSQDGNENGDGRSNRSRQRCSGGQGNGGNGGRRKKDDDDDRDDDNDDIDDDYDENNDDEDDDDDDEQTGVESSVDEPEMTPEQEAEMAQELLSLIPPKHLNCDPPEKPAKPGTAVDLHGIVLHETSGGLVVLNVRWRNKIYSGALIDVRKSKWASERIKPDPFPEAANPRPVDLLFLGGSRRKSKKSSEENEREMKRFNEQQNNETFKEPIGLPLTFKRPQDTNSNDNNNDSGVRKKARLSPPLIECPEPNCGKRYSHKNGLKYHQAHAHQKKDETDEQKVTSQKTVTSETESVKDIQKLETEDDQITAVSSENQDGQLDVVCSGDASFQINDHNEISVSIESDSDSTQALPQTVPQVMPQTAPQVISETATQIMVQNAAQFMSQVAPQVMSQIVPQIVIKTEEESAVDSIKDVNFEHGAKEENTSQDDKDVTKIMLTSSDVQDPVALFPSGSSVSLTPFTTRSSLSFAQFSPTLASLNPQIINNSLSNALQTAVDKEEEKKTYTTVEGNESNGNKDVNDEDNNIRSNLELDLSEAVHVGNDAVQKHLPINKDIKNEEIIPSSPDDFVSSDDILPDSLGIHLYQQKDIKENSIHHQNIQQSQTWNNETTSFSPSLFSVSLYNQIRQEQASRLFPGADSVTGNLAEPSDIQRAISQVDVRRHFSPMLLNYLNTGSRVKDSSTTESDAPTFDDVSTSDKTDDLMTSNRKIENKESMNVVSTSFSRSSPRPDSVKKERHHDNRLATANLPPKPEFLQPNISAGRPISRPATKPERITGGLKIAGGMQQRYGNNQQASNITASEEVSQSSLMFAASSTDSTVTQSTGKQGSHAQSSFADNVSPSSYLDKTMIEAKTWVPQEVYRQPTKPMNEQERSKDKRSSSVRMPLDAHKKTSDIDNNDEGKQQTEQNISIKMNKQEISQQHYHSMIAQSSGSDKGKDYSSNEKEVSAEVPETSRFTLTSEGLVSSFADSRGRPRKIRVEKTKQIPIGNVKDVEMARATPELNTRKHPITSYTRSSVIHSMSTPPEEMRMGVTVKEEYVSPEGKRKGSPRMMPERSSLEKKMKQDFKKNEANRIFEAEREKLKNRHVESHYANEVRNLHLRANELPSVAKSELGLRRSVSPCLSRMQSHPSSNQEKQERHMREKLEAKGIPMSPAFGQSSPFHSHSSSDIDKLRSEYMQHDLSRLPVPFGGSLLQTGEGYPGLPTSFPSASYFGHRSIPSQRFDQLMSSHIDQEKAYSKYSTEKSDLSLKHTHESSKIPSQDRMRVSSRDGHSHRSSYYPQASPLGYPTREANNPSRSPKSSPFGFRPSDMFATSRSQRMESEAPPKDSKAAPASDNRRDIRRDYGIPYSSPFFQPSFQYPNMSSAVPSKGYSQRINEQRSPYKHSSEGDKSRYQPHPSNQPQSGPTGMLSANLVLTKADSLGFGSLPYDNRNPEGKK